jgi:hypothetical protein
LSGLTAEPAELQPAFDPSNQSYTAFHGYDEEQKAEILTINATPSDESINVKIVTQVYRSSAGGWVDTGIIPNGSSFSPDDVGRLRIVCTKGYQYMEYIVLPMVKRS